MSSSGFGPYAAKPARWGHRAPPSIASLRLGTGRARGRALVFAAVLIAGALPTRPLAGADRAPAPAASADWVTRSWQSENGLPQDTVNAIAQTRDGFLWVGTSAGLARFDGVRFRKFGLQDGLRSVLITALAEDRQGALWVGTSGGGVSRWDGSTFTSLGAEEGWPAGLEVITLAADRDGSVWVGTDKGLVQWRDGAFKMFGEAQGLPQKQIRALLQDSQATLWVSVIPGGLYRGTGGEFRRAPEVKPTPGDVYTLLEDRDGAIWAGAAALWKWSGAAWQRFDTANGLPWSGIHSLAQAATAGSGLARARADCITPAGSASSGPPATGRSPPEACAPC